MQMSSTSHADRPAATQPTSAAEPPVNPARAEANWPPAVIAGAFQTGVLGVRGLRRRGVAHQQDLREYARAAVLVMSRRSCPSILRDAGGAAGVPWAASPRACHAGDVTKTVRGRAGGREPLGLVRPVAADGLQPPRTS